MIERMLDLQMSFVDIKTLKGSWFVWYPALSHFNAIILRIFVLSYIANLMKCSSDRPDIIPEEERHKEEILRHLCLGL